MRSCSGVHNLSQMLIKSDREGNNPEVKQKSVGKQFQFLGSPQGFSLHVSLNSFNIRFLRIAAGINFNLLAV